MGKAAGEVMLLLPLQGLLNLPGAQGGASVSALWAHFPCPQKEEVVCAKLVGKGWRQQQMCIWQRTANFWKLPWLHAKMGSAQRKRRVEAVMWPNGP